MQVTILFDILYINIMQLVVLHSEQVLNVPETSPSHTEWFKPLVSLISIQTTWSATFIIFAPKMAEIVLDFQSFDMEPDTTAPVGAVCRLTIWRYGTWYPTGIDKKTN